MAITVQLMSGDVYTLDIFYGYRIVNTKNDIASILRVNRDLVTVCERQDSEFDILDNMDYVEDGKCYYAFIGDEEDPPEYLMKYSNIDEGIGEGITIIDENTGKNVDYIQKSAIVHVQMNDYGWQFLRNVLRENRYGVIYDSDDEYDDPHNDRYENLSKEEVVNTYLTNYSDLRNSIGGSFEIVIHNDESEDDEDEDEDEDDE